MAMRAITRPSQLAFRALAESVALFSVPIGFLVWYTGIHGAPSESILPHLGLMTLVFLSVMAIRMLAGQLGLKPIYIRAIGCAVITSTLLGILAYYSIVAIGLQYWGRVVSLELLLAYSGTQLLGLLDALGLAPSVVIATTALSVSLVASLVWIWLRRGDWTAVVPPKFSAAGWTTVALGILGIVSIRLAEFVYFPPAQAQEPVALTIFPAQFNRPLQGLGIDAFVAAELDSKADAERLNYAPAEVSEGRNVVLIVVDAQRPDRMGVMGAQRATTPYLSSLANNGAISIRGNLHSVCAESACGLLGISASRFPHQFSNRAITLGEVLRMHGYQVHMILSGDHTGFYGLRELYGVTDSYQDGRDFGGYINEDRSAIDFVSALPKWSGTPVMFQFHLMSTHNLGSRWPETQVFQPASNYARPLGRTIENAANYYDNGVYQTDSVIQEILEHLEAKGFLENALVVVTADHGELLGEHGLWAHAKSVFEPAVRIPFLLIPRWGHAGAAATDVRRGSQVDIAPTILRELGLPIPSTWSGQALQELQSERIVFFRQDRLAGLVDHKGNGSTWKYWMDVRSRTEFVFEINSDPSESNNLVREVPSEQLNQWRRALLPVIASVNVGIVRWSFPQD